MSASITPSIPPSVSEGDVIVAGGTVHYVGPQPNAALVVGPDDHLVISLPANIDPESAEFEAFQNELYTRLPRDQVTVVCGAEQLAVIRNVLVEAAAREDGHSPPE